MILCDRVRSATVEIGLDEVFLDVATSKLHSPNELTLDYDL